LGERQATELTGSADWLAVAFLDLSERGH